MIRQSLKRLMDVMGAGLALVTLAPLMAVTAFVVWLTMGRPLFFRQQRPGFHGRAFVLLKFRTMRHGAGDDSQRLTATGRLLRSLSVDELPQFWNVLKGDMSLVGPRPLLMEYLDRYTPEQARRHEVRPGLTGWTAVNGRNALSWDQKFALDVWYVDHWSLALDCQILFRTIRAVFSRSGVSQQGHATMPEFRGRG